MSTPGSSSPVAYFDLLPDEILLKILRITMKSQFEFFPEHCLQVIQEGREGRRLSPSQHTHLHDWRIVNATSGRIRRLGREAFFRAKIFAMSASLPGRLRSGAFPAFGSAADQALALRYIRSVVWLEPGGPLAPRLLTQMPGTLRAFRKLERVVVVFRGGRQGALGLIPRPRRVDVPPEMRRLLGEGLILEVAICEGMPWPGFPAAPLMDVYLLSREGAARSCLMTY
ncbi:hypothetical protein F4802DRAFT_571467 [Xylaria palmicola]|nr:hypothetical protein F4802DRAFT_571467 [Xylaria palmicola]